MVHFDINLGYINNVFLLEDSLPCGSFGVNDIKCFVLFEPYTNKNNDLITFVDIDDFYLEKMK